MKSIVLIVVIYSPLFSIGQSPLFKPQLELLNTKLDTIEISHYLLNEPAEKNYQSRFKVLEFWATWCRPCLKAVPHLNRLQAKFADSNLVFLSFTYETPQKVAKTLQNVKFETVVVSDTARRIHRRLRIDMNGTMPLPRTVLIDNENNIVWYGDPDKLTEKLLHRFLRKETL
ncbi:MAG: TlpA family protein disulfide reductase [Sphingobacteriales bacterium]|nr:MAG: TlpA family protein disulfide reductase [Sphingobacteriales bacterium]